MSVNKVILMGNVGQDPQIKEFNENKFASFSLATTEKGYTKKNGTEIPDRTEWHSIVATGSLAQVVEKYVTKGTKLYIEGRLHYRKYTDKSNTERSVTEIRLDTLEFCGGKRDYQDNSTYRPNYAGYNGDAKPQPQPEPEGDDDGLPF